MGRDREIRLFSEWLVDNAPEMRILNLYGTGGVGKSYLLDEYRRLSEKAHVLFLYIDSRAFPRNPSEFCTYLLRLLRYPIPRADETQMDIRILTEICAYEMRKAAAQGKMVLALDTFEEFGEMETWIREEFLPHLSPSFLTIISGRQPLQGAWLSSPGWRQVICRLQLADLPFDAVKLYLERAGIGQEETIRHIWSKTLGHPLTLSLFASTSLIQTQMKSHIQKDQEIFPYVVSMWLKEVPDRNIRVLVEAAAVLRHFNLETLAFILEKEVTTEQFLKLTGYSFIRRVDRGWLLHDLLRDTIGHELRLRAPEYYDKLWKRCVLYYYLQINKKAQKKSVAWESAEWVYYIGDRFIRTLFYQQSVTYSVEPLHPSNWTEAERYIEGRILSSQDMWIRHSDPETDEHFEYFIAGADSLLWLQHFHMPTLFELDPSIVKLIRDEQGKVCGMAEIVPIHEGTLDFLLSNPPFSSYFASLTELRLNELRTPRESVAGYFIASIDVIDYADPSMRQAAGLTFISCMLSAGLIVTTSPTIPFFHVIFQSLGFEKTKDIVHFDYSDRQPTPYFVLDTRGKKRLDYLNKMIASFGIAQDKNAGENRMHLLSKRERDVIELLIKGHTNSEIAAELYLSEATVKKHVFHIFRKFQVNNRVGLMNQIRDRS